MTLSAMTLAILNVNHGWSIWAGDPRRARGRRSLVGLVNGALVVLLGIDSLIVTLGTLDVHRRRRCSGSATRRRSAASRRALIDWVVVKQLFGIPLEFYYGIALGLVMFYVFEFMPVGRRLLFVGRGRSVARLSGIRVVAAALGRARRLRRDQRVRRRPLRGHARLRRPDLGPQLPAARVRGRVPRRDDDHARAASTRSARSRPSTSSSPASPGCSCSACRRSCSSSSTAARSSLAVALSQAARRRDARQID